MSRGLVAYGIQHRGCARAQTTKGAVRDKRAARHHLVLQHTAVTALVTWSF